MGTTKKPKFGKPIKVITDQFSGRHTKDVEHCFIFVIDGCRPDALYDAIFENENLESLREYMEETGCLKFKKCHTVLPSVTIPCNTSIVTGTYPGYHGIIGNNWFDRTRWAGIEINDRRPLRDVTREYVKLDPGHPFSDPGLGNGLLTTEEFFGVANNDMLNVKTIYEAYNESRRGEIYPLPNPHYQKEYPNYSESASFLHMITRNADCRELLDFDDVLAAIGGITANLIGPGSGAPFQGLDRSSMDDLITHVRRGKTPGVAVIWLPGMDNFSHTNGAKEQPRYFSSTKKMNAIFDRLFKSLIKKGLVEKTLIIILSDHGQYDCGKGEKYIITEKKLYQKLENATSSDGERLPYKNGKTNLAARDASVVISQNGGSCFIYLEDDRPPELRNRWSQRPSDARIKKFCEILWDPELTEQIFGFHSRLGYGYWDGRKLVDITGTAPDKSEYIGLKENLDSFTATLRAPDIILTAREKYYYAAEPFAGEHGSYSTKDTHVPLIFIHPRLKNRGSGESGRTVKTVDIVPTVGKIMGFYDHLLRPVNYEDKLEELINALEKTAAEPFKRQIIELKKEGRSDLRGYLDLDFSTLRTDRGFTYVRRDVISDFRERLSSFADRGLISSEALEEFEDRFQDFVNEPSFEKLTSKMKESNFIG